MRKKRNKITEKQLKLAKSDFLDKYFPLYNTFLKSNFMKFKSDYEKFHYTN